MFINLHEMFYPMGKGSV